MKGDDLIATARVLVTDARSSPGRPRQSDLHRAVSTAYYAVFHELCRCIADSFVGGTGSDRSEGAWRQTYRSLQHRYARGKARDVSRGAFKLPSGETVLFPDPIVTFADSFVVLQDVRITADYDPSYRISVADADSIVAIAEEAIASLRIATPKDRCAFCVWVVFGQR